MSADLPVPSGIPVVVAGIPTYQDEHGIVSPFPYLNSESDEWKGADEEDEGFDTDGGVMVRLDPDEPEDGGGEEADFDDEDDLDDDDTDMGLGILGGIVHIFAPPPLLPA